MFSNSNAVFVGKDLYDYIQRRAFPQADPFPHHLCPLQQHQPLVLLPFVEPWPGNFWIVTSRIERLGLILYECAVRVVKLYCEVVERREVMECPDDCSDSW